MASFLDSMIRLSAPVAEAGLSRLDAALRGTQSLLAKTLGTGAPTGVAPIASIIQPPVRVGVRILMPSRSFAVRIGLAEWITWPACTNIAMT